MSIFDGKICSYYKNIMEHVSPKSNILMNPGINRPIIDILTNERYTNTVHLTKLRQAGYNSEFYKNNKNQLSAATFSCIQDDLTIDRSDKNILSHTGFMCFDIDSKGNPGLLHGQADEMKDFIIDHVPYVCYLGKSVSNIGFWGMFAIRYKEDHYGHFEAMKRYFASMDIVIDSLADPSRLRFVAYDPDAHFELHPQIYYDVATIETPVSLNEYYRNTPSNEFFLAACRWVEAKNNIIFEHGSRHKYLRFLYSTLRHAHVRREDCLSWIYGNLITPEEVKSNCLDEIIIKNY